MSLAIRHRQDTPPSLPPIDGLEVHREADARVMAALQGRDIVEMRWRFGAGHRAYVAWHHGVPAAFGWVATRAAAIGELSATFVIPASDRYLWNFVTLPQFRGLGIYPRLLDAIVRAESVDAERCWIAYAPENHASGAGIRKAGFVDFAELSFDVDGQPAVRGVSADATSLASRLVGLKASARDLAPCWRCVRAGRPALSCAPDACRCDYQVAQSGCAA